MMRFAICNELYRDWPWDRAFAHARQCGYDGVELAPHTLGTGEQRFSPVQVAEVRLAAADQGLEIIGLHWLLAGTEGLHWTAADRATQIRTLEYFRRLIDLCQGVGGTVMVLGSPKQRLIRDGMSLDAALQSAAGLIEKLLPRLADARVTLAIEPLGPEETNFLNTAEETVGFLRRFSSPWVKLHLDVKAMSTETHPIPEIIRAHASDLVHFHANDPNRRGPGMGTIDFVPILRELIEVGYQRWISVEVFDESPGIDVLAGESLRNLRRDLDRARRGGAAAPTRAI